MNSYTMWVNFYDSKMLFFSLCAFLCFSSQLQNIEVKKCKNFAPLLVVKYEGIYKNYIQLNPAKPIHKGYSTIIWNRVAPYC